MPQSSLHYGKPLIANVRFDWNFHAHSTPAPIRDHVNRCLGIFSSLPVAPWQIVLRAPMFGALLCTLGFSLIIWARIHFTFWKTTLFVGSISAHLVCNGPFRFSRNPMYVGVVVLLSGIALWFGTCTCCWLYQLHSSFCTSSIFHTKKRCCELHLATSMLPIRKWFVVGYDVSIFR